MFTVFGGGSHNSNLLSSHKKEVIITALQFRGKGGVKATVQSLS